MNKKIVLNDDSGNPVEVDLKIFIDHINHYHKTAKGQAYTRKEVTILQLIKHLGKN